MFSKNGYVTGNGTVLTEETNWSLTVRTSSHPCVRELITSPVPNVPHFVYPRLGSVTVVTTVLRAGTSLGVKTRRVLQGYRKVCHRKYTKKKTVLSRF